MAKPPPRSYNPAALGAKCDSCPFRNCGGELPVPPKLATKSPKAALILENPGPQEKFFGKLFCGEASKALISDLKKTTLHPDCLHVVTRIACCPSPILRTDSNMRKAAIACLPRFQVETVRYKLNQLPRLYFGKWAPVNTLPSFRYTQPLEIKMLTGKAGTGGVVRNNAMWLPHPQIAYFHKPALKVPFRAALSRFADFVKTKVWISWDTHKFILEPSEEALEALRSLGSIIAYDTETLGVDPLTAPITALGISDEQSTISLGWASYKNRHGIYQGIIDKRTSLDAALVEACREVLESDRIMVAHNGSYDLLGMSSIGIRARVDIDTLDAYKILYPELPANLEDVSAHILPGGLPSRWKTEFRAGRDDDAKGAEEFAESPRQKLLEYNARDTLTTRLLGPELMRRLEVE